MNTRLRGLTAVLAVLVVLLFCSAGALAAATINVPAGGDFQAALNSARAGDVIMLAAGATFQGPFVLPANPGSSYITIRTSAADSALPPPGARIDPSYAGVMPKLVADLSTGQPVIRTTSGSNHFQFIGVEISPTPGTALFQLVLLGTGSETSLTQLPIDFVFDRCYLHGDPAKGTRRGIAMNVPSVTVMNSYLSDFKIVGSDSQALACWNGPGPLNITNNYLEASGENILLGGQDPTIVNLVPTGITIRQNHFSKPLSWRVGDPSYQGTHWTVKNLLEIKNATQLVVDGNLFENNWADAQNGFAILFTPRNQDNTAPWSVVSNVQFTNNIVQHVASGISILGTDDIYTSQQLHSVTIKNNLFVDISAQWGGQSRLFQMLNGALNVTFDHNTGFPDGAVMTADQLPSQGLQFTNNLANHGSSGFFGSNYAEGSATLAFYFPGAVFQRNAIIGGNALLYPTGNFFPAGIGNVGFVNAGAGQYGLLSSSTLHNAGTDGADVGVNMTALNAAQPPTGSPAPPSITVTTTAAISLDPAGSSQTVTVTVNRTNFTGSVALSVSALPSGVTITGKTDPGTNNSGSVTFTAAAGAAAVSNQPVIITASGSGVTSQTSTVLVTVNPRPSISISATPSITLSPGGAGQTVMVNVTRTNFTGSVTLSVSSPPNGVTTSQTDPGTTNSGSVTFSAAAGAAPLSGKTITITASGSGISAASATFTLTVTAPTQTATLGASVPSLAFNATVGANPANQTFQVQSLGTGSLNWSAGTPTTSGGGWLSVLPPSGSVSSNSPSLLTVSAAAALLPAGTYGGTIVISAGTQTVNVAVQLTVTAGSPYSNQYILAQVADGDTWTTTFNLSNPSSATVGYLLKLTADSGAPLAITANGQTLSQFTGSIGPGASVTLTSSNPPLPAPNTGLAVVQTTAPLVVNGIYTQTSQNAGYAGVFEAGVPSLTAPAQSLLMPFDQIGKTTGLAIANLGNSSQTATLTFRDENGKAFFAPTVPLAANAKTAFLFTDSAYNSQTTNHRGTVQIQAGSAVLAALGLRVPGGGAITSLPVYATDSSSAVVPQQILSHVIDGAYWQSTITLVNLDAQPAPFQLQLYMLDPNGNPAQISLNGGAPTSTYAATVPPLSSLTLITPGIQPNLTQGWASITSSQRLRAQVEFTESAPGFPLFEAAVSAFPGGVQSLAMPYDNTKGLLTGITVVNTGSEPANVQMTVRDSTDAVTDSALLPLSPGQKRTFYLADASPAMAPNSSGKQGLVQLSTPTSSISALILRINGQEITTLPVAPMTNSATPVDLSSYYNRTGIYTDGTPINSGGLDSMDHGYSANLLGSTVNWNGATFNLGPANSSNTISATSNVIPLPAGTFSTLLILGTGVNGGQGPVNVVITYSDGTSQTTPQFFSDWLVPQPANTNESQAVTMAYRNSSNGAPDSRPFVLYGYSFSLDKTKTVKSITLPNNGNVEILAIALAP